MRTIVWDVDDVLNDLMRAWFTSVWKPAHADSPLRYQDIADNPPYRSLNIAPREYLASLDEFRLSGAARCMTPNPAIMEWLWNYGAGYRHVALTARPLDSTPAAAEWLFRHFGDYFRCFGVAPSRPPASAPHYDSGKRDFLEWLGRADFLVDDSARNLEGVRELGVTPVLYPQPWNGSTQSAAEALRTLSETMVAP